MTSQEHSLVEGLSKKKHKLTTPAFEPVTKIWGWKITKFEVKAEIIKN